MPSVTPTLAATPRELLGKQVRQLRRTGLIPAVVYGHKKASQALSLGEREFSKLYQEAGNSTLINLTVEGHSPVKVLIHDVQNLPGKRSIAHVDFYIVNLKEKLHANIALSFVGNSEAVDSEGGSLMTVKDEVEVECLPDALVAHIEVDISALKTFEDSIRVSDLQVPEGMTVLDDPEAMIASVAEPRSEEEMLALEEPIVDNVADVIVDTADGTAPAEGEEAAAEEAPEK